ncbi:MAG: hypothetical protein Q7R71_01440 [bacterium]|nr:hypothetical protein [bacterium]
MHDELERDEFTLQSTEDDAGETTELEEADAETEEEDDDDLPEIPEEEKDR